MCRFVRLNPREPHRRSAFPTNRQIENEAGRIEDIFRLRHRFLPSYGRGCSAPCAEQGAPSLAHAYQMLEAGVRQFTAWGNTDAGRHILIAVARYLAAHSPTERATLQTADIARRLMLGAELHQEAGAS